MKEELLKGLTKEQIEKVKACKNQEEILALAKAEGIELSDEQLEAVSGGCDTPTPVPCSKCGSTNVESYSSDMYCAHRCLNCGASWIS